MTNANFLAMDTRNGTNGSFFSSATRKRLRNNMNYVDRKYENAVAVGVKHRRYVHAPAGAGFGGRRFDSCRMFRPDTDVLVVDMVNTRRGPGR